MKGRTVIHGANIPMRLPVGFTWLMALSVYTWNIPGWLTGILWFLVATLWAIAMFDLMTRKDKKVFEDD